MRQCINLVTLGVASVADSAAFYERLGWRRHPVSMAEIAVFETGGVVLALFGRSDLAEDATVPEEGSGFRAVTLACNMPDEASVEAALREAEAGGARIVKPARKASWGGYCGYFADPDGHLWEVTFNPVWPLSDDGRIVLPA